MSAKRSALTCKSGILIPLVLGISTIPAQAFADTLLAIEAESTNYSGGATAEYEHAGYSGSSYLGGFIDANKGSAALTFSVNVPQAGEYTLDTRYTNATGSSKTLSLYIDNQFVKQLTFSQGASWSDWIHDLDAMQLTAGSHTVSIRFTAQDSGNVNIDQLTLIADDTPITSLQPGQQLELESASFSGGAVVESNHSGYSGTGFLGGFTDSNKGSANVSFNAQVSAAGDYQLTLTYANGTPSAQTLSLLTDGVASQFSLPTTSGWSNWSTVSSTVTLSAGTHNLGYLFGSNDSGNVNLDAVALALVSSPDPDPDPDPDPEPTPTEPGNIDGTETVYSGGAVIETEHSGYTGNGYIGGFTDANKGSAQMAMLLDIQEAGNYSFAIHYANGTPTAQTLTLAGDNLTSQQVTFPASGGWASWAEVNVSRSLPVGLQEVLLQFTTADSGNINIDSINVTRQDSTPVDPTDPTDPPVVTPVDGNNYQAESAFYSGGAYVSGSYSGAEGNAAVVQATSDTSRIIATVHASQTGDQAVTVRYRNETAASQVARLTINGVSQGNVSFEPASDWQEKAFSLSLQKGRSARNCS